MKKSYQYALCIGAYVGSFLITFLPYVFGMKILFRQEINELITYLGFSSLIISLSLIHLAISRRTLTVGKAILLLLLSYQGACIISRGLYGISTYFFFIPISSGFFVSLLVYLYSEVLERKKVEKSPLEIGGLDALIGPKEVTLSPSFAALLGTSKRKISREEFERILLDRFTETSSLKLLRSLSSLGNFLGVLVSEDGNYIFYGLAKFGEIAFLKLLDEPNFPYTLGVNKQDFLGFMILTDERVSYLSPELERILGKEILGEPYSEILKRGKQVTSNFSLLPFPYPIFLTRIGDYVFAYKAKGDVKLVILCAILDQSRRIGILLLKEGIVEYATNGAAEVFGVPESEIVGRPFWAFFSERDKGAISSRIVDLRYGRARYVRRRATVVTYVKEIPVEMEIFTMEGHREYQVAIVRTAELEMLEEQRELIEAMRGMLPEILKMVGDEKYFGMTLAGLKYLLSFSRYEALFYLDRLFQEISSELDIKCDVLEEYATKLTERELGAFITLLTWVKRNSSEVSVEVERGKVRLKGATNISGVREVLAKLEGETAPSREQDLWISLYVLKNYRKRFEISEKGGDIEISERRMARGAGFEPARAYAQRLSRPPPWPARLPPLQFLER